MAASQPSAEQLRRCTWDGAAGSRVSLSTTTAKTAALTEGTLYRFSANVAWHISQGPQASVTATTDNAYVAAYERILVWVPAAALNGVAAILDTGTGFLTFQVA